MGLCRLSLLLDLHFVAPVLDIATCKVLRLVRLELRRVDICDADLNAYDSPFAPHKLPPSGWSVNGLKIPRVLDLQYFVSLLLSMC